MRVEGAARCELIDATKRRTSDRVSGSLGVARILAYTHEWRLLEDDLVACKRTRREEGLPSARQLSHAHGGVGRG